MFEPLTLNANYELLCVFLTFQLALGLFKISIALLEYLLETLICNACKIRNFFLRFLIILNLENVLFFFFYSEMKILVLIHSEENFPLSLFPIFICTLFNIWEYK